MSARPSGMPSWPRTPGALRRGQRLHTYSVLIFTFRDEKIIRQEAYDCYEPFENALSRRSLSIISVGVEVEGLRQPLAKLIIDLGGARQVDQVDHRPAAAGSARAIRAIAQFVWEIEAQQHRPHPRPELGELAVALEEDPDVDGILVDRPESAQMLDDGGVDLTHPARMPSQQIIDRDARNADVRLVGGREFPFTVRAYPTRHAADCAAAAADRLLIGASVVVEFPLVADAPWSTVSGLWRSLVAHLTGGQGVASSNLASPTKAIHPIRPSRTRIQPTFLPPSITPSDGRSGPATDHQAENAVPASSMACTSGCR